MSETMQTVVESTKILTKWAVFFAVFFGLVEAFEWLYTWYGFSNVQSGLYAILTLAIPGGIFIIATIVWTEAKHRVWKANKGIE